MPITRRWLQRRIEADLRPDVAAELRRGSGCGCATTAATCRELLTWEPALWTIAYQEGVEPTNNRAERALRPALLWRKRSFGCHSEDGCRFVERLLTVVQTLRLQGRDVLEYLQAALTAHRHGLPAPKLPTPRERLQKPLAATVRVSDGRTQFKHVHQAKQMQGKQADPFSEVVLAEAFHRHKGHC